MTAKRACIFARSKKELKELTEEFEAEEPEWVFVEDSYDEDSHEPYRREYRRD